MEKNNRKHSKSNEESLNYKGKKGSVQGSMNNYWYYCAWVWKLPAWNSSVNL